MLKKAVFLVLAFCLLAAPVLAEQVQLKAADQPYTIEVLESDLARTVLQYEINAFDMGTVDIAGREFSLLDLDGRARHMVAGMPELPTLRESIVIPDDASMTLRVLASELDRETAPEAVRRLIVQVHQALRREAKERKAEDWLRWACRTFPRDRGLERYAGISRLPFERFLHAFESWRVHSDMKEEKKPGLPPAP